MNVLITGHSGFIGGATADVFHEKNHVVYGVSRAVAADCKYHQYSLNLDNYEALNQLINEKCIDVIIHFAGKPIVADCDRDPYAAFKINGLGTAAILEAARNANVKKVVCIETDKVYGFQEEVPTNETAIPNPGSPYEFSKVLASSFCDFYRDHYNMDVVSVRPANVFGPGDYTFTRIVPASMRNISEGKGIPVQSHAVDIRRDFIYIKDVAQMCYLLATEKTEHPIYNLSTNESISIMDFAKRVTKTLAHRVEPIIVEKPGVYPEIPYQSIDGTRFVEEFDFVFTPFDDAIQETYKEYCEKFNIPILGR